MQSHVERVSEFYSTALKNLGTFAIAPAKKGFEFGGPVAFKLFFNHTDPWSASEFLYWGCCITSPCIYIPGVALAELGALSVAAVALTMTLASTPFAYSAAGLIDCCDKSHPETAPDALSIMEHGEALNP